MAEPLLSVRGLRKRYRGPRGTQVDAVAGIDFDIAPGETLGLVGESGCGKTTVGRSLLMLPPPDAGSVVLQGVEVTTLSPSGLRAIRPRMQMVFQDPISSLNPRRSIGDAVAAPLRQWFPGLSRKQRDTRVAEMLEAVGLEFSAVGDRLPHELSGGQCQRVSIARALILEPRLLLCDEPVSSLDVSVQAQILNLLLECRARFALTMLFIAHDLAVVRHVSDRIAVMYLGRICEILPASTLVTAAAHPYTRLLLASAPDPRPHRLHAPADPAAHTATSPLAAPGGCRFRMRCPMASERCAVEEPRLREIAPDHLAACHHVD